jgi:superfamily II DNA or RNA helicase
VNLDSEYYDFIESKKRKIHGYGFDFPKSKLNKYLMNWQKDIVCWAIGRGRSAIFAECGTGKTIEQLEWARIIHEKTNKPVIIHCPVGVREQTKRESDKFSIKCKVSVVNEQKDIIDGINLVNYEKIHKFDTSVFGGVVLDESSILKGETSKTREQLNRCYESTPYRLACTATPAPNDHVELGNHAEFLGICDANDMLNRYFVHDSGETSVWRLRGHAHKDFWAWVSQWAVCVSKPSDVGGDDTDFILPELRIHRVILETDDYDVSSGFLFNPGNAISATTLHSEKRLTNSKRCKEAARIVGESDGQVLVWCDTNYEADELIKLIPDAVEVRGNDKDKESKLLDFADNKIRVLISKPSIAGFGMNYQNCNTMIFAGLSYSFEQYYQAVRRCWRFGQKKPVDVYAIIADTETAIESALAKKQYDHLLMQSGMALAMAESQRETFGGDIPKSKYVPKKPIQIPGFLVSERG